MGQYNKILCLLFVIFIVSLLQTHCKVIEGLDNLNSFTNCIDDPEWFVENSGTGRRMYCSDIGNGVSCYDRNAGQVEGWERCLKTCGNCSTTKVTTADMKNMATFSGDPIDDFGVVLFRDDDRNWVGKDVGEDGSSGGEDGEGGEGGGSDDVRNFIGTDESEDIVDIYDRLSTMESLYEMLMGSVSSCVDCSQYESSGGCPDSYCDWIGEGDTGSCELKDDNDIEFYGCNGESINCDISTTYQGPETDEGETIGENILIGRPHVYLQHQGDKILFPTVEMSCNEVNGLLDNELSKSICIVDPIPLGTCIVKTPTAEQTYDSEVCEGSGGHISNYNCDPTNCDWTGISLVTQETCATHNSTTCVSDEGDQLTGCKLEKTNKDICQSYFLLETSLTQDDDDDNPDNDDDDNPDNDDEISIGNRNSPTRISLYDMCPRQCVESCFIPEEEVE